MGLPDCNRHIVCNEPDTVIKEKDTDMCLVKDVAIPSDYNIQKKVIGMISKYVDHQIECHRMWNEKVQVIPVIKDATGLVENNIKKYFSRIPRYHNITNLQRSEILGTAIY